MLAGDGEVKGTTIRGIGESRGMGIPLMASFKCIFLKNCVL